jgi:hypothetical protein
MNQAQHIKAMAMDAARTLRERGHDYPLKLVKQRMIAARHGALTYYGIPRSVNGQKLGLRKREVLALRVKE